jgi:hypothetical protein
MQLWFGQCIFPFRRTALFDRQFLYEQYLFGLVRQLNRTIGAARWALRSSPSMSRIHDLMAFEWGASVKDEPICKHAA